MGFEFPNYDRKDFFFDLKALQDFCKEKSNFDLQNELCGTRDIFNKYNRCFSFYFFKKLKNLYFPNELNIEIYKSSSENFTSKSTQDLFEFERFYPEIEFVDYAEVKNTFQEIWDNFGIYSGACFLFQIHSEMFLDLKKKRSFIEQEKRTLYEKIGKFNYKDSDKHLNMNLAMSLGLYNFHLKSFLDLLAARQTLVQIYEESKNFPLFREEIFKNILSLDQKQAGLAAEFLLFRQQYLDIRSIQQTNN